MLSAQDRNLNVIRLTYGKYEMVEVLGDTSNQLFKILEEWEINLKKVV